MKRLFFIIVVTIALVFYLLFLTLGIYSSYEAITEAITYVRTRAWKTTPTTLLSISRARETCTLRYSYTVDNTRFTGTHATPRSAVASRNFCDRITTLNATNQLRTFYNPSQPRRSALSTQLRARRFGAFVLVALLILSTVILGTARAFTLASAGWLAVVACAAISALIAAPPAYHALRMGNRDALLPLVVAAFAVIITFVAVYNAATADCCCP